MATVPLFPEPARLGSATENTPREHTRAHMVRMAQCSARRRRALALLRNPLLALELERDDILNRVIDLAELEATGRIIVIRRR